MGKLDRSMRTLTPAAAVAATLAAVLATGLVGCAPGSDHTAVEVPVSPRPVSAGADQAGSDPSKQQAKEAGAAEVRGRTAEIDSPPSQAPTPNGADTDDVATEGGDAGEEVAAPPAKGEFPAPPTGKPAARPPASAFESKPRAHDTEAPARLVGVVVAERDGWEELTFTFAETQTVPTYDVSYVDAVRPHEEAEPVPLSGNAFLQVNLSATDPNTDGQMTIPSDLRPEQAQVKELVLAENLGGELRFGIGLDGRDGFHVQELKSPTRLVVQFKSGS